MSAAPLDSCKHLLQPHISLGIGSGASEKGNGPKSKIFNRIGATIKTARIPVKLSDKTQTICP